MTENNKLIALCFCALLIMSVIATGIYYWASGYRQGTINPFYLTEPSISNGTIVVSVWQSQEPLATDIYVGFDLNNGNTFSVEPDNYKRCVANLNNNVTSDWIGFIDVDNNQKISVGDKFIISTAVFNHPDVMIYKSGGYYSINFSYSDGYRKLVVINVDASKV
jgi:hypothetical protein